MLIDSMRSRLHYCSLLRICGVGRGIVAKELASSPEIFSPEEDIADSDVVTFTVEAELSEEIAELLQPGFFDLPAKRRKLWPRGVLSSRQ